MGLGDEEGLESFCVEGEGDCACLDCLTYIQA